MDWKKKLGSRKLWAAILAAAFAAAAALFGDTMDAETVDVLKTGICGLIAYIFGEGIVDAAKVIGEKKEE